MYRQISLKTVKTKPFHLKKQPSLKKGWNAMKYSNQQHSIS